MQTCELKVTQILSLPGIECFSNRQKPKPNDPFEKKRKNVCPLPYTLTLGLRLGSLGPAKHYF
jgi:hypothetical protein